MKRFFRKNWFVMALMLVPIISYWVHESGVDHFHEHGHILAKLGVGSIFFLSGLMIQRKAFLSSLQHFSMLFSIQGFCFLGFPLLTLLVLSLYPAFAIAPSFSIGIIILACMPTTISSCVVMTSLAKGNESAALLNGIFSNFLGIFICPFLVSFFLGISSSGVYIDPYPVLQKLMFTVLIPLLFGCSVRFFLGGRVIIKWTKSIRYANSFIVLAIIYIIFFDTFEAMPKEAISLFDLLKLTLNLSLLHLFFFVIVFMLGVYFLKFNEKDVKALLFTAPHKTLALGMPLTMAILSSEAFATSQASAMLIALPLALYHHLQLIFAGIFLRFKKYLFPIFYGPIEKKKNQV